MRTLLLLTFMLSLAPSTFAQLRPSLLFSDGMVMQRGTEVPVWGWAAPGEAVTVMFDGQSYTTEADADGAWRVRLPAMAAGGPYEMTIQGADEDMRVRDILMGDVWVASGQSNMEWTVANVNDAETEIAAADDPHIRHFKVPQSWSYAPETTLAGGSWEQADPAHVGNFTAVGYFFARALRASFADNGRDVPIGILNTSWGGSRIEPWMSAEVLGLDEAALRALEAKERADQEALLEGLRARLGDLPTEDAGWADGKAVWAAPDLDDAGWAAIAVPGVWEQAGYEGMDGIAWYRTTFALTEEEAQQGVTLGLGMIDDSDITWVNGVEVGRIYNAYNQARIYEAPASALRAGANVLTVRVEDTGGGGGIHGSSDMLFVEAGGAKRPLAGTWRFRVGAVTVSPDGQRINKVPTVLWNKMVHPLLPFPIKGAIWYQGESNANNLAEAVAYKELFPQMIEGWRAAWGQGDFPFLWSQLANFMAVDAAPPAESNWATLRESQSAALALPNTGQAVIIDIGEADDIHPRNKQDVGRRLALAAQKVAYGGDLVYAGPTYRQHVVQNGQVIIAFDHVGNGLEARNGDLGGFALAGTDKQWAWADAKIEGNRVVVWSEAVPEPVAVRYAWGNNPESANLYNDEGLPAVPFRTDAW